MSDPSPIEDPRKPQQTDPLPEPTPDQLAMGLRSWMRRIVGMILVAALLVVIVRGIYVAWQVQHSGG